MSYDSNWFMGSRVLFQESIDNGTPWDFYVMCVILHRVRYNGNNKGLELGQCLIGLRELGKLVGKDHKSVSRSLKRLENKSLIRASYEPHLGTKITVLLHSMFSNTGANRAPVKDQQRELNVLYNTIHKEHICPEEGNETPKTETLPSSPETSKSRFKESVTTVINHLNQKVGRRYAASGNSQKLVEVLLKKGHTVEEFQKVIDSKVHEWIDDPKMKKHLTPPTLFRPSNFEKYLEAANAEIPLEEKYAELLGLT